MSQLSKTSMGTGAALFGLALGSLLVPFGVAAQEEGTAAIEGAVYDSTAMQPLVGARVAVIGTNALAETDGSGRFRLENVPAGPHWVSFYHERLQTLGVSPPSRQITFHDGQTIEVELAVPSEETLLAGWCLAEQQGSGYGAVAGMVTDSLTGVPMPHALVTAQPISRLAGLPIAETYTDDSGYFRLCDVRADMDVRLQAHFGQSSGRSAEVYLAQGGAQVQDLMLLMSAEGTLAGYVRDYATGDPVPGATVSVMGTGAETLTDGNGRFILGGLPPGRHLVTTDHLAFEARTDSVTIFSEETVDIEVHMATQALEVEGLVVTARTRFGRTSLAGDDKRADFIGREEIEAILPRVTAAADLLRNMNAPGLRIREVYQVDRITGVMVPSYCIEVSRRSGGEGCVPAAVVLNGVVMQYPDQVIRDMDPNIIDRIEILNPTDGQFQFGSSAANGAVVIYTR